MRRRTALAALLAAAIPGAASAQNHQPPPNPYVRGGGGMLTVNGRQLPRDQVFRFLPVTLPLLNIRVTSLYGLRSDPFKGFTAMHAGVDFGAPSGTAVFATSAGVVTRAGWMGGYGNTVDVAHGLGFSTRYAHMSSIGVQEGQVIDRNTVVGLVGSTGTRSTGPHLHYEIRNQGQAINPIDFILRMHRFYNTLG